MMKSTILALALAALGMMIHTGKTSGSDAKALVAAGGSNCPVYYGCPVPPPPQKGGAGGGGNAGGGNAGGGNSGGVSKSPVGHA